MRPAVSEASGQGYLTFVLWTCAVTAYQLGMPFRRCSAPGAGSKEKKGAGRAQVPAVPSRILPVPSLSLLGPLHGSIIFPSDKLLNTEILVGGKCLIQTTAENQPRSRFWVLSHLSFLFCFDSPPLKTVLRPVLKLSPTMTTHTA